MQSGPEEELEQPLHFLEPSRRKKMNKNKNTVSLDSKAGDVLTPAWAGGSGNRPWESGIFGTR